MTTKSKYRFILIPPFHLPDEDQYRIPAHSLLVGAEKEKRLLNNKFVLPHLEDVDWDLHPGATPQYGNWSVENTRRVRLRHDGPNGARPLSL